MAENINKIWGERRRIHLDEKNEIDLLYLKQDTFCSTHTHKAKSNKFIVIKGKVRVETEFGHLDLTKNTPWTVHPPMKHRFVALEDSIMIEIAYVKEGQIDPEDIQRESQGGRWINGEEITLDQMKEKGLLDL